MTSRSDSVVEERRTRLQPFKDLALRSISGFDTHGRHEERNQRMRITSRLSLSRPMMLSGVVAGAIIVTGIMSMPSPSAAQYLGSYLESQRYHNLRHHQQRLQNRRDRAPRRSVIVLTPQQRACAARFPSYSPRSGLYIIRPGVAALCRL